MEVTYELTQKDLVDCFLAHRRHSTFSKWIFRVSACTVMPLVCLCLLVFIFSPKVRSFSTYVQLLFSIALMAVYFWGYPWWAARVQFTKQPGTQGPITVSLDNGGVHWKWNGSSSDVQWKNYIRIHESKTHFLFYRSPVSFNIVPKRALTPEQQSDFRAFVAQYMPNNR